jgi:hypothetical protein
VENFEIRVRTHREEDNVDFEKLEREVLEERKKFKNRREENEKMQSQQTQEKQ